VKALTVVTAYRPCLNTRDTSSVHLQQRRYFYNANANTCPRLALFRDLGKLIARGKRPGYINARRTQRYKSGVSDKILCTLRNVREDPSKMGQDAPNTYSICPLRGEILTRWSLYWFLLGEDGARAILPK
jgi:hypothetical protein